MRCSTCEKFFEKEDLHLTDNLCLPCRKAWGLGSRYCPPHLWGSSGRCVKCGIEMVGWAHEVAQSRKKGKRSKKDKHTKPKNSPKSW